MLHSPRLSELKKRLLESPVFYLFLFAALSRLVPHPPNMTGVGALALFAGALVPQTRTALLVVCASLLIGDIAFGFHALMPFTYGAFILVFFAARALFARGLSASRLLVAPALASGLFFVVSNFGVWLASYPKTLSGLAACYTLALPFLGKSFVGDFIYSGVFFGTYFFIAQLNWKTVSIYQEHSS